VIIYTFFKENLDFQFFSLIFAAFFSLIELKSDMPL